MSELQEIDVFINPDGSVRIEVRGAKGEGCLAITKDMEQLLGGLVVNREHTDEFNQQSQSGEQDDWQSQAG